MKKGFGFIELLIVIGIIGSLLGIIYGGLSKSGSLYCLYNPDYTCTITVDKSEKIEQAVSNSIEEVKSRNFKIIGLEVRCMSDGTKKIICRGITEANLIKDD